MGVEKTERVWLNGALVDWDDANVHILTHTLHYGLGVFEGIRCYLGEDGSSNVFRLRDHVDRLFGSARIVEIAMPFARDAIEGAILDTLRANRMKEGYIRPLVYLGAGAMGLLPKDNPPQVAIIVWPWGAYLGDEGLERGIRAKVSSYTRHHPNVSLTKSKTCGDYVNSILAKREVTRLGYDEAVMLDTNGLVAECSGENIFIVRRGLLKTPPLVSVLEGITRDSVIRIARDKGIEVVEQQITRDEVYCADEMFLTGTAAEITPVRELDDRTIGAGARGPLTKTIQTAFFDAVHGRDRKYESWLTRV
ncbi:MAG TPA: branched-chain amino acid transaminase [Myxococcota bacterium]|nr:branched-chain amino acid transaminase [Myxococcota bacterium]